MIKLSVIENKTQFLSFKVEGHSTLGKKGNNILCAGVSSLAQGIILGLTVILKLDIKLKKEEGFIECSIPQELSDRDKERVNLLIMTMIVAFEDFKIQYPSELDIQWIPSSNEKQ